MSSPVPSAFCGQCEFCLGGRPALCDHVGLERGPDEPPRLSQHGSACIPFAGLGGLAEEMLVHEHAVAKIRDDMPLDRAALIGCAVTTGVGAVFRTARVEAGSTVGVIGCGGVGLNCVQGAALAGASRIVAIDTNPFKLDLATKFGADRRRSTRRPVTPSSRSVRCCRAGPLRPEPGSTTPSRPSAPSEPPSKPSAC